MKTPTLSRKAIIFPVRCSASFLRSHYVRSYGGQAGVRLFWSVVRHLSSGVLFSGLSSVLRQALPKRFAQASHPASVMLLLAALILAGAGCSTPPKVVRTDPEIERNVAVAHGAYAAGSAENAAIYYQKALQRARVMDSPAEIARNAYNLAACLAAQHSYDAAQACLDEARLEFKRADMPCRELPLLEAKIARAQGRSQEALSLARAEQKKPAKAGGPNDAIRIQWHLLLAELLCDQDQAAAADAELAAIDPKQLKASGTDIQAETALTRARIQILKRNPQAAALQYDSAAGYWQAAGRYSDMAVALEQAGRAYEDAGNSPAAVDRYYRAARSLCESGQLARACELADRALPLAAASHHPDLQRQVERLKAEIEARPEKNDTRRQKTDASPEKRDVGSK